MDDGQQFSGIATDFQLDLSMDFDTSLLFVQGLSLALGFPQPSALGHCSVLLYIFCLTGTGYPQHPCFL